MANSIYLKRLIDKNVGPLSDVLLDFSFFDNGNPKPVIFVGENGSGKTTILSNIVDAFFEMAGKAFSNANCPDGRGGYQYFKIIAPCEIHTGASFLYSFISFAATKEIKYIFKSGNISVDEVKKQIADEELDASWNGNENVKIVTAEKDIISNIWENNVLCYWGPDRYEKPVWMGNKYYQTEEFLHPSITEIFNGKLKNPIAAQNVTSLNLRWLLDIIADSRADIEGGRDSMYLAHTTKPEDLFLLKQARSNLETIISTIIGEEVYFQLNYRNRGISRFKIIRRSNDSIVCPTLNSLSTGQIALFNLFATIVRYADNNNIDQSIYLNKITGIVVIDEIELHLHSKLQKEVLPTLLKLFPKIQFIITSHAPLFLLGMKDTFGEDGFDVYEMPSVEKITTEKFAEFHNAYGYLKDTETYQQDVKVALDAIRTTKKTMVITEGSTDWKHLKAAYNALRTRNEYHDLFESLDFEFFEYEPKNSQKAAKNKLDMGDTALIEVCKSMAKLPQDKKYIFIADRDNEKTNDKMSKPDEKYKKWGNNVYSFILPVPSHRIKTPNICIEHLYSDDEIKTEWVNPEDNIPRRLFIGNEFDDRGVNLALDRICGRADKCGCSSIAIIEGSSGEKVTRISNNDGTNYALSKSKFAEMIFKKQKPFDNFNFENFIEIFEIIRAIIDDKQGNDNNAR